MKKLRLYLETSIFNFYYADDVPKEREMTRKFFQQIGRYETYISEVLFKEIGRCKPPKREKLLDLVMRDDHEELVLDESSELLARRYVKEGIIPIKYMDDAYHIAIASVAGVDLILSWNFEHIVKVKTKREVVGINMLMGYGPIDIYSPLEVVEHV
jgi:hypothetical protein